MSTYSIGSDERTQHGHHGHHEHLLILRAALANCETLVRRWLPGGKLAGDEYTAINPRRADKGLGSFKINVKTGRWSDFAEKERGDTSASGGSPISYYAYINNMKYGEAKYAVARDLRLVDERGEIAVDLTEIMAKVEAKGKSNGDRESEAECIMPVPDSAQPAPLPKGAGKSHWTYRNADGRLLGYTVRVNERDGGKRFFPLTYWTPGSWQNKHWPGARPIYGLDRLASDKDSTVLVVEGEKAADAGQRMFGQEGRFVVVSWPGGANSAGKVDWSALQGRRVWLLPDHDEPGRKAMQEVELQIRDRADSTELLAIPEGKPEKWDIADEEGLTVEWLEGLKRKWLQKPVAMVRAEKAAEPETKEQSVQAWEEMPVPALAEMERQIGLRVNYSHPIASQQIALALAAHACGRAFVEETGEPCALYLGLVAPADIYRGYNNAAFALLLQAGRETEYTQERLTSGAQLYGTVLMRPNLFHVLLDFSSTVHSAKRQPYGTLQSALNALVDLYEGQTKRLEGEGTKKTAKVIESPTITALAMFPDQQSLEVFCETENARNTLGCFQFAWIDEDRIQSGSFRRNIRAPYPDDVIERFKTFRPANFLNDNKGGDLPPASQTTVRFTDDCEPIIDAVQAEVERLFDMDRARMAGRNIRRTAAVLAVWRDSADPVADSEIVGWCCRRERSRAMVEAERIGGSPGGGEASTYDKTFAKIAKSGKSGIKMRDLSNGCSAFKALPLEDRHELIERMIEDGKIACVEKKRNSKILFAIAFLPD